jgi:hypothetical protein
MLQHCRYNTRAVAESNARARNEIYLIGKIGHDG